MKFEIEQINPLSDTRWQPFVEASCDASIFHHRAWLALLHAQYHYPILAHCVTGADGEVIAGLPLAHVTSLLTGSRLVAVPFADLCGPVARDGDPEATRALTESIRRQHELAGLDVEIRAPINGLGHPGSRFLRHTVPLDADLEAVRHKFHPNVRRRVARAEREGVEVIHATGREALDDFYRLHAATRRRKGVPVQPKRFIRRLASLYEEDLGFVLIARFRKKTIAANVFLAFNGVLTGKYNASDPSYLRMGPNNALLMEAIRWGCNNGYRLFDLGRTDLDNKGLRSFKRSWGAEEHLLTYTLLSRQRHESAQQAVPPFARTVLRRSPTVVGRLVGTALYRHYG